MKAVSVYFVYLNFLPVHLNSYEGGMHFSCCSVLYSFHLVFCGHSDLSYVAHFPKCIERE